jgi:hypothetical protein
MTGQLHFIITISWSVAPNSWTKSSVYGLTDHQGSRYEVFEHLVQYVKELKGIPDYASTVVDFFALEPNVPNPPDSSPQPHPLRSEAARPEPSRDGDLGGPGRASN